QSASFPVKIDEPSEPDSAEKEDAEGAAEKKAPALPVSDVTIHLDEGHHDLKVGYVVATPLWRPSYRLVLSEDKKVNLQVWGIVQNQSGEDWQDIELSLVAGSPLSFQSTLADTILPERPLLTDRGDVVSVIPESLVEYPEAEEVDSPRPAAGLGLAEAETQSYRSASKKMERAPSRRAPSRKPASRSPAAFKVKPSAQNYQMSVQTLQEKSVETTSGSSTFHAPQRVTIPNQSATMVLLLQKDVEGRAFFSYDKRRSGGERHPYRVVDFKNSDTAHLDRGPISVFQEGQFLGQGVLSSVPKSGSTSVPISLVRSIIVESSQRRHQVQSQLARIHGGVVYANQEWSLLTDYTIRNTEEKPFELEVMHYQTNGYRVVPQEKLKKASEPLLWRGLVDVEPKKKKKFTVDERSRREQAYRSDTLSSLPILEAFLRSEIGSKEQKSQVQPIVELMLKQKTQTEILGRAQRQVNLVSRSLNEVQQSLRSIEKNKLASKLRARLTKRLGELQRLHDEHQTVSMDAQMKIDQLKVEVAEALKSVELKVPSTWK
ncbi:MAG: DUF4139 domain-containing protein, partial [Polyangiaceae bacterium]|nr:DUF4139 domain-containing protein [Polyangiaceae bacterium]